MSLFSVKRYMKKADHGESLAPKKSLGSAAKLDEKATKLLEADLKQRPFATLQEKRRDYIQVFTGLSVSHLLACRAIALLLDQGCELLCLPAYSPDSNPIEEAFAKIKNLLRKAAARSKEALVEAIGVALSAVTAQDARDYFEHAGYCTTGQLP